MSPSMPESAGRWKDNPYGAALGGRDPLPALVATPLRLRAVAECFTPEQFARSYAPGKWPAAKIILHLAQTELAFAVRLRMALTSDNYVVQPFDQDGWMVREPAVNGPDAIQGYLAMRHFNLPLYRSLTPADRARVFQHPERGAMQAGWILEILAGHELHLLAHLETIAAL